MRYLLSHQAGLPAVSDPLPLGSAYHWDVMTGALAKQAPLWEPGTKHGYHAFTYGWLVGEVVRRIASKTVGAYWREEIAGPLGLDFQIGTPAREDGRIADCIAAEAAEVDPNSFAMRMLSDPIAMKVLLNPPDLLAPEAVNSREWRAAEIPAANGHGTARAVARLYAALARGGELDGVRVMSAEAIKRATVEQAKGQDAVLLLNTRPALGFVRPMPDWPLGPNDESFGHSGSGGSLGFADPEAKVGFGYVMNRMIQPNTLEDPRWRPLTDAIYAAL